MVVPTLGSHATLGRVLDGLGRQKAPPGTFELVLAVDAAEPDPEAVAALVADRPYPVRLVRGERPGASANRNAGMKAAGGALLLFIDNDTVPTPPLVAEHLRWHERHPDETVGVLGRVRWAPELKVTPFMRWLDTGIQFDFANIKGTEAGWGRFATANVSLKRSFALAVGDFDQDHFPYGYEDTDWAYRAHALGFRLLYNRRALVDHLRDMDVAFWQKRVRRVARAELTFCRLHPEMEPWFHNMFSHAAQEPRSRGRAVRLARYVPRRTPWLGRRVWDAVDRAFRQELAPHFLAAWEDVTAGAGDGRAAQPDLSEFDRDSPAGRHSGGPK